MWMTRWLSAWSDWSACMVTKCIHPPTCRSIYAVQATSSTTPLVLPVSTNLPVIKTAFPWGFNILPREATVNATPAVPMDANKMVLDLESMEAQWATTAPRPTAAAVFTNPFNISPKNRTQQSNQFEVWYWCCLMLVVLSDSGAGFMRSKFGVSSSTWCQSPVIHGIRGPGPRYTREVVCLL